MGHVSFSERRAGRLADVFGSLIEVIVAYREHAGRVDMFPNSPKSPGSQTVKA